MVILNPNHHSGCPCQVSTQCHHFNHSILRLSLRFHFHLIMQNASPEVSIVFNSPTPSKVQHANSILKHKEIV